MLQYRASSVHIVPDHFFSNTLCNEKESLTDAHRLSQCFKIPYYYKFLLKICYWAWIYFSQFQSIPSFTGHMNVKKGGFFFLFEKKFLRIKFTCLKICTIFTFELLFFGLNNPNYESKSFLNLSSFLYLTGRLALAHVCLEIQYSEQDEVYSGDLVKAVKTRKTYSSVLKAMLLLIYHIVKSAFLKVWNFQSCLVCDPL